MNILSLEVPIVIDGESIWGVVGFRYHYDVKNQYSLQYSDQINEDQYNLILESIIKVLPKPITVYHCMIPTWICCCCIPFKCIYPESVVMCDLNVLSQPLIENVTNAKIKDLLFMLFPEKKILVNTSINQGRGGYFEFKIKIEIK